MKAIVGEMKASNINSNFSEIDSRITNIEAFLHPDSINIKAFGAMGDGIANDTAAIQQCFDSLQDGQIVYFPSGLYLVDSLRIENKNYIKVHGDGWGTVIKLTDQKNTNLLNVINSPRFILENMTFDGNYLNQSSGGGIYVERSEFSVISKLVVKNCRDFGVRLTGVTIDDIWEGTDEINIHNCYIYSNGNGIEIEDTHDMVISNCNVEFNRGNGINIKNASSATIVGSMIVTNDQIGIHLDGATRILVSINHIRNNGFNGIKSITGKQHTISDNIIHMNGKSDAGGFRSGILVAYMSKVILSGNQSMDVDFDPPTQTYGLETYAVSELTIIGNDFTPNAIASTAIDADTSYKAILNIGLDDKLT